MSKITSNTLLQSALFSAMIVSGNASAADTGDGFYQQLVLRENTSFPKQAFTINANLDIQTPHAPVQQNTQTSIFTSGRVKTAIQPYEANSNLLILMIGSE